MKGDVTFMIKYKHIEAARELRLWLGQVIIPTVTVVGSVMLIPEVRQGAKETVREIKSKFKKR